MRLMPALLLSLTLAACSEEEPGQSKETEPTVAPTDGDDGAEGEDRGEEARLLGRHDEQRAHAVREHLIQRGG